MKLPTIRRDETSPATTSDDAVPLLPPLSITVTQTIEEKVQAYMLQRIAYGLNQGSGKAIQVVIWIWLVALLSFGALTYDDIKSKGLSVYFQDLPVVVFVPSLIVLVLMTIACLTWSATTIRRRQAHYRRQLRRLGETASGRLDIIFDGDGISTLYPSGAARRLAWQDGLKLHEDENWLSFYISMQEMHVVIPKRDLSSEEIEAIRQYSNDRHRIAVRQPPAVSPAMIGTEIVRTEDFAAQKDDLVVAMVEIASAPQWRRHRFRSYIVIGMALSLLTPLFYFIGWAVDPDRLPPSLAFPLYLEMFASFFWKPAAIAVAVLTIFAFIQERFQRYGAGLFADKIIATGTYGTGYGAFGENGIWGQNPASRAFTPWNAIRAIKITEQHFLITLPLGAVAAYPKRVFPQERLAEIETLLLQRAAKPRTGEGMAI